MNKHIKLKLEGDLIYLNSHKSNLIKDGLIHIIQNSVDHGIEKEGLINITVKEKNGSVLLQVSDNGKGIDANEVLKKAIQKNITSEKESENYTNQEKIKLIMEPGFSTKEVTSEYSGRGVGLDVVKTNIEKLGGHIEIESKLRKGTLFKIVIPR